MIEIKLDTENLDKGLAKLLRNATDSRPMMSSIATELQSITEDNFASESWGAFRWPRSKRVLNNGGQTLQKSGQLAGSISTSSGLNYARISSSKPYAAIHHLGGNAGRNRATKIPARPYLPIGKNRDLQKGADTRILEIAVAALKKGL